MEVEAGGPDDEVVAAEVVVGAGVGAPDVDEGGSEGPAEVDETGDDVELPGTVELGPTVACVLEGATVVLDAGLVSGVVDPVCAETGPPTSTDPPNSEPATSAVTANRRADRARTPAEASLAPSNLMLCNLKPCNPTLCNPVPLSLFGVDRPTTSPSFRLTGYSAPENLHLRGTAGEFSCRRAGEFSCRTAGAGGLTTPDRALA